MKKAGLYDQYRYPNRMFLSAESVEPSIASGSSRALSTGRNTTAKSGVYSQTQPSSFDLDDADLLPSHRIVTARSWWAFGLQLFTVVLNIIIFLGPGWGRSKRDARTDVTRRTFVKGYHGFWFVCEDQVTEKSLHCSITTRLLTEGKMHRHPMIQGN